MPEANARAIGMLKTALEMEEKGYQFYEKAAQAAGNELGRGIFSMLREDEVVHVERIKRIFASLTGGEGWNEGWKDVTTPQRDLGKIFRDLAAKHGASIHLDTTDLDALDIGLDFEARAVAFYRQHLEGATAPLEIEFTKAMIEEERLHHELLADMKLYLTRPESWFREREKSGLDGA